MHDGYPLHSPSPNRLGYSSSPTYEELRFGESSGYPSHAFLIAALVLMLLATGLLYLTYFTGIARAALFDDLSPTGAAIAHHRSLAGYTISAFTCATGLFAMALFVRRELKLEDMRDLTHWIPLSFMIFYGLGVFWLVLTAHQGAMLAHELIPSAAGH